MNSINTKQFNPVFSTAGNQILGSRGDFILGYKISYPEKYSQSESDFESIFSDWVRGFNNLPIGSIVVKSDMFLQKKFDASILGDTTYLQRVSAKHFEGRKHIEHTGYIFFICPKLNTLNNNHIKNPFRFPKVSTFKKDSIQIKSFCDSVEEVISLIQRNNYLSFSPLSEKEIKEYNTFYFNGFQEEYLTDLSIERNAIRSDKKQIGIYSITNEKHFPDTVVPAVKDRKHSSVGDNAYIYYQGFIDDLTFDLNCNHIYNQILFIDESKIHRKALQDNLKDLQGFGTSLGNGKDTADKVKKYEEENSQNEHLHYVRGHNNIIFWSEDEAEFDMLKRNIGSIFRALDFTPYYATGNQLKNIFLNSFYANVSCLDNYSCFLADLTIACTLFTNSGNYKNDKQGIFFNERLYNTPVRYDFWDNYKKYIVSRNFLIVANTGAGKSFTADHIFRQINEQDILLIILDLGDSYLKYAKLLNQKDVEIFKYKEGEPLGLNPFALNGEKPTSIKIEELAEFVWMLIKKDDIPTESEKTSMRKIIKYYYEINDAAHSWESFYRFVEINRENLLNQVGIENADFFNIGEFLHAGGDFVGDGIYANLLKSADDKAANFVGKKLIIFELDEIKDNALLLSIMLQCISEAVHRVIWSDKKNRGIVFFDEFGKQLKFPAVLSRVSYYAQAIRKQNGALGLVLQTLAQLPDCPESQTVLDNTETFVFLQDKDYTTSVERLKLSEHDKSQLYSMRSSYSGEKKYSEFYLWRKKKSNVYRIEVAPENYLAFQTEGPLHVKAMELYEQYGSMEIAIKEMMKLYKECGSMEKLSEIIMQETTLLKEH